MNAYEKITHHLISRIESGDTLPWDKGFSLSGLARNYVTGHVYSGINLLLNFEQYADPYYLTFKQTQALGGYIKKGSEGIPVVFTSSFDKEEINTDGSVEVKSKRFLKYFTVFNISCLEGVEINLPNRKKIHNPIEAAQQIVNGWMDKPTIMTLKAIDEHFGLDSAYYNPINDHIKIPTLHDYHTPEAYYKTLFHELIHATGHTSRLKRESVANLDRNNHEQYAMEEVIAELGAAFLCAEAGIFDAIETKSASYIKSWKKRILSELQEDNKFIFKAMQQAQKACELILGKKEQPVSLEQ